jgi:tetratricopeptide (TPR) repeat protein
MNPAGVGTQIDLAQHQYAELHQRALPAGKPFRTRKMTQCQTSGQTALRGPSRGAVRFMGAGASGIRGMRGDMDPVIVNEVAAALARADLAAWEALAALLPGEELPERAHVSGAETQALAARLVAAAVRQPGLLEALSLWAAPAHMSNMIAGHVRIAGSSVQARDVQGGIHIHGHVQEGPRVPTPRQLLPSPPHFTDRAADLRILEAFRAAHRGNGPLTVVVSGAAGVGKTALVSYWLQGLAREYADGQLYADLHGHSKGGPTPPSAILGQFLRAFGMEHVPAELGEQAALWRTVTADSRIVVMLDNAVSAAQVRPLLPASPAALIAVTSRSRLSGLGVDGAAFHRLDVLDSRAAVDLLSRHLGCERVAQERESAYQLTQLCGGLPLAICVAAARMAARPKQSLAVLAGALSREGGRLTTLDAGGERAVRAALDQSYEALPTDTARGYRRLGLTPVTEFGNAVTAAVCAITAERAERLLDELVEVNLVEEMGADRYRFHDLVRLHAAHRAAVEEPSAAREEILRRALDWYLATATEAEALLSPSHRTLRRDYQHPPQDSPKFHDARAALAWLDTERLHLMAAVRTAAERGWHSTAWQLVDSMQPLFLRLRPYDLWIEAHRIGLAAAGRAGHREGVSRMLTTGGSGLRNVGRYDEAIEWFTQALLQARQDGDRRAEAQALHGLGQSHRLAGRLEPAASLFAEALTLREAIGYTRGAALSRLCLGDIALARGHAREAVALLARAREELLAVPDPYDAARALAFLGIAHAIEGIRDFATANRQLRQALTEFAATGSVHWQGRVLEMLGETAEADSDPHAARAWYEQSLATYAPVSPMDARRLKGRLGGLGPS